jgi:hypothetical protein
VSSVLIFFILAEKCLNLEVDQLSSFPAGELCFVWEIPGDCREIVDLSMVRRLRFHLYGRLFLAVKFSEFSVRYPCFR